MSGINGTSGCAHVSEAVFVSLIRRRIDVHIVAWFEEGKRMLLSDGGPPSCRFLEHEINSAPDKILDPIRVGRVLNEAVKSRTLELDEELQSVARTGSSR